MEVTDGPNECDQAALGSPQHFFFGYMWCMVDAVRKACPVFWTPSATRYADDLISQKCDTDTRSSWGLERNKPMKKPSKMRVG